MLSRMSEVSFSENDVSSFAGVSFVDKLALLERWNKSAKDSYE